MSFDPGGVSPNPRGRPPGSRNKRTEAIWSDLEDRGDIDPADYLSSKVSDPNVPPELRAACANYLLPYKYSKRGSTSPLRYIEEPIQAPHPTPTELTQVLRNIDYYSDLKAQGRLDMDAADGLIADQKAIASILIEDKKLVDKGHVVTGQHVQFTGGLPELPGTSIDMSQTTYGRVNGHELNGKTIDHETNPGSSLPAPDAGGSEPPPQATNQ